MNIITNSIQQNDIRTLASSEESVNSLKRKGELEKERNNERNRVGELFNALHFQELKTFGLNRDVAGIVAQFLPFRTARNFLSALDLIDAAPLKICASSPFSLADLSQFILQYWNDPSPAKKEEIKQLTCEYYSLLQHEEAQEDFRKTLNSQTC